VGELNFEEVQVMISWVKPSISKFDSQNEIAN
jgi:hypothetical protein